MPSSPQKTTPSSLTKAISSSSLKAIPSSPLPSTCRGSTRLLAQLEKLKAYKSTQRSKALEKVKAELHQLFTQHTAEMQAQKKALKLDLITLQERLLRTEVALTREHEETACLQKILSEYENQLHQLYTKLHQVSKSCGAAIHKAHSKVVKNTLRVYTSEAHAVARTLKAVGGILLELGHLMGVRDTNLPKMSQCTVQHVVAEGGIAASIKTGFKIVHNDKNYESHCIAVKPVNADDGTLGDGHVLHSLGVDNTQNHSSEAAVGGMLQRLNSICHSLTWKFRGTNGDYANDVKKDNQLLFQWKMEYTYSFLGKEEIEKRGLNQLQISWDDFVKPYIDEVGGQAAWEKLPKKECEEYELQIAHGVYSRLDEMTQQQLSHFLFSRCCMHKELNSIKGSDKALPHSPILLVNKDNAAVLSYVKDPSRNLTPAEIRALESSGSGGIKAMSLAGMILNNKDKKKDVSNMHFHSHVDAACELLTHLTLYREFIDFVFWKKDKLGHTNLEANFKKALHNPVTLMELAVLALYGLTVSYPYLQHVRSPGTEGINSLDLDPLHDNLKKHIQRLIRHLSLVLTPDGLFMNAAFDGLAWHRKDVFEAIQCLLQVGQFPVLKKVFIAFLQDALETWEHFTVEFSAIKNLPDDIYAECWMPATNDVNEGSLGSMCVNHWHCPTQTQHQFNTKHTFSHNNVRATQVAENSHQVVEHQQKKLAANQRANEHSTHLAGIDPVFDEGRVRSMTVEKLKEQLQVQGIALEKDMKKKEQQVEELLRIIYENSQDQDANDTNVSQEPRDIIPIIRNLAGPSRWQDSDAMYLSD
ncbi:hypothetical protein FISHEDRAFT_63752 [Fistulina hepatica ATCC 64428]|uniref:Uncharacterized protein n=1 Tax=Fistulina hepatica ATCC 64428 TaxID=1128425 RepID=A0A0D7AMQ3_9AGAR|nr:hypothetical protein FISHEDRAFT_63752 [Fistulina hepatica ATCC 64428]